MKSIKSAKSLLGVGIVTAGLLISYGYVSLSNDLSFLVKDKTSETSKVDKFNVEIVDVQTSEVNGTTAKGSSSFTKTSVSFDSSLLQKGDSIFYTVKVKNSGNKTAKLNDVNISEKDGGSEAIYYVVDSPEEVLEPGETADMTVIATYDEEYVGQVTATNKEAVATVVYQQVEE